MPTVEDLGQDVSAEAVLAAIDKAERPLALIPHDDEEEDEDFDETMSERLWGLTEMFPESVRNGSNKLTSVSKSAACWIWENGRKGMWVLASSATILVLPVMFETERVQMEEAQIQQQRQLLLGPNAAVSGGPGMMPGMPPMPVVSPPK